MHHEAEWLKKGLAEELPSVKHVRKIGTKPFPEADLGHIKSQNSLPHNEATRESLNNKCRHTE